MSGDLLDVRRKPSTTVYLGRPLGDRHVLARSRLEHEHRNDGTVLMAHGTLLCRYRLAGPGEWDLVDLLGDETWRVAG